MKGNQRIKGSPGSYRPFPFWSKGNLWSKGRPGDYRLFLFWDKGSPWDYRCLPSGLKIIKDLSLFGEKETFGIKEPRRLQTYRLVPFWIKGSPGASKNLLFLEQAKQAQVVLDASKET